MKAYFENIFSMLRAVQDFLRANIAIWGGSAPLTAAFLQYETIIAEIRALLEIILINLKGLAIAKGDKEKTLVGKSIYLRNAAIPYANSINDPDLKAYFDISETELAELRDTYLVEKTQGFHSRAVTEIVGLATYGIDAPWLASYQIFIDDYDTSVTKPRTAISGRKTANAHAVQKIKDAKNILTEQIDYMVGNYSTTHPAFSDGYTNVRIVVDLSGGRSEVKEGLLAGGETKNIFDDVEDDDKLKIENQGSSIFRVCRTNDAGTACTTGVDIQPGETVNIKGVDLAADGSFLNITNLDVGNSGRYKVSRD